MQVRCYRDCDARALRKVVVEVWSAGRMLTKRRMFAWRLEKRLKKVVAHQLKLAAMLLRYGDV